VLFMRTKHTAKKLAKQLSMAGIPAVELHGNLSQGARERNLSAFTEGSTRVLVATDIAARGIHVDDVALVIHADPPVEHKAYLHRSGRTARAGNEGTVVTMMLDDQVRDVRDLTRKAGIKPTTTRVQLGHPLLTELAPGDRSYAGGLVREEAPAGAGGGRGGNGGGGAAGGRGRGRGRGGNGGASAGGRGAGATRPAGEGGRGRGRGDEGSGRAAGAGRGAGGGRGGQAAGGQGGRRSGGAGSAGGAGRRGGSSTVYSTSSGGSAASFSAGTRAGSRRSR
jgi:hypothetical protein